MAESDDRFDLPSQWRAEAIRTLRLDGDERIAGAVTGAAYPDALGPIIDALESGNRVCDVGAGLGAASNWIAERAAVEVVAVEPEWKSARAARSLFPAVPMIVSPAAPLPIGSSSVDGVTMLGLLSLVADLDATIAEAIRVLRPGGMLCITDLWSTGRSGRTPPSGDNEFRTVETLVALLARVGADVISVWTAPGDLVTEWDEIGRRVDDEMAAGHGDDDGFLAWHDDREHLGTAIAAGELQPATVVARWCG